MIARLALLALLAAAPQAQRGAPSAQAAVAPPQSPEAAQAGGTIVEDEDNYIITVSEAEAERPLLSTFVNMCQEATGRNFTFSDATGRELGGAKLFMYGTKVIPKEDFYAFFQIMMFINDFVCVDVGPPHISITLIQSLTAVQQAQGKGVQQRSEYVRPEDLYKYADQPATLVTTVLHLPNTDARNLSTSLRTLFTDTLTSGMAPATDHSVILRGFGSSIAALAELLYLIDEEAGRITSVDPVFDVIPLEFASAEDVADLIDQLLEARGSGSRNVPVNPEARGPGGVLGGAETEAKILVDGRTNSLLVMALPEDMPHIKELVAALDVDVVEPERNYHVYNLQNVAAEELSEVLDEFLQDAGRIDPTAGATGGRAQAPGATGGGGSSSRSNEVVVVHDEATNSLLIAAGKTRYEEVLDLIQKLDKRQDQVLIETALVALEGKDFRDIGVELAGADVMGDGGFGVTSFGLSSIEDTDDDGVPDLRVPNVTSGVTAGFLDGDDVNLPILLAAIDQLDESNVLNVPSVLVNNNRTATVRTLDEQPTTTITATGGVGGQTQESFDHYEEAGITLTITPSISAANYLRLSINLLVSTFSGSFQGSIPPPRITRELTTTVNVPDGDTMVIGGIITDNASHTRRGVPFFGDLPLIGLLFRRDTNTDNRTTLYFFVTPHILQDDDFADLAEISYRKKLEAAGVIGSDRLRVVDPAFNQDESDVDWSQFGIPLYKSPERGEVPPESVGLDPIRREELLRAASGAEGMPPAEGSPVEDPLFLDEDGEAQDPR
jgi:general secretion pathway protein D